MIQQKAKGLNSRSEAIPYLEDGFLPLITAPMYSVVDDSNYQLFLDNKIQVCLPRRTSYLPQDFQKSFLSISLSDFKTLFINNHHLFVVIGKKKKVCIDTANGNMPQLHEAIREAKNIHGDDLIIMAGNVSSVEAFVELAKTGADYIRVGIGGGSGCNTTNNTGVGQENLSELIYWCKKTQKMNLREFAKTNTPTTIHQTTLDNLTKVKIVADGISSYIKLCQQKYNFNDNGYAAIIKLLNVGADLVMIGGLFAQCYESAGEKAFAINKETRSSQDLVKVSGMSTIEEQTKYKEPTNLGTQDLSVPRLKPSEGSTKWVPVRWTLENWLQGSDKQDEYPYLNGFVNSLKSAMSYIGSRTLNEFKS